MILFLVPLLAMIALGPASEQQSKTNTDDEDNDPRGSGRHKSQQVHF